MVKRVHNFGMTPLDREVAVMVGRIGASRHPENHIAAYSVEREADNVHFVTVRFVADDEFDSPGPDGARAYVRVILVEGEILEGPSSERGQVTKIDAATEEQLRQLGWVWAPLAHQSAEDSVALIEAGWLPTDRVAALREMAGEATGCGVEYETLQNRIMAQLPGPHGFGCECDEAGTDPRCAMKAVQP